MNELELAGNLEAVRVRLLGWRGGGADTEVSGRLMYLYIYLLCENVENHLVVSLGCCWQAELAVGKDTWALSKEKKGQAGTH